MLSVLLILGVVQLAFIGIIGEYLARDFEEMKQRPLYFFKQGPESQGATRVPERRGVS